MAKFLDQDLVTRYAQMSADIKEMTDEKVRMHDEIVEGMRAGLKCPRRGPYFLKLIYARQKQFSWKKEFIRLAKAQLGKAWMAYRDRVLEEAPRLKVPKLLSQVNPRYVVESDEDKVTSIKRSRGAA
jgi:hypothetical protein